MAVVNKFNVNKQQVTLDPDIIENMSANDVPYDSSFQYDKNTVGNKLSELGQQVIYDVTANNDGATFTSLSELLSSENLSILIPSTIRCGGMSIRFVQSSDNKYVQYRLISDEFTTDTTQWVIADEGIYVENPEFIYVKVDKDDKILWAIKTDGSIYYGAGVPQQVKDYINEKIRGLSLDEYEDIVTFLSDYLGSDYSTLMDIIGEWNNAVSGKKISILGDSISTFNQDGYKIDGYAMYYPTAASDRGVDVTTVNDTWWMQVINSVGGTLEVNASSSGSTASSRTIGFSPRVPLLGNPDIIYVALGTNDSGNGVTVGDINFEAESYDLTQFAPAYIKGMQDTIAAYPKAKIVCVAFDMGTDYQNAIKTIAEHYGAEYIYVGDISVVHPNKAEMTAVANRIVPSAKYTITDSINTLSKGKVDKDNGKSLIDADYASSQSATDNPEYIEVTTDAEGKVISYRDSDGVKHEECGIVAKKVATASLNLSDSGMTEFQKALISSGFNPNTPIDLSDEKTIHLPIPRTLAKVNIIVPKLPVTKTSDFTATLEYYDFDGNYFKKPIILNAQGSSSMAYIEKNLGFDLDDGSEIQFGNWVPQDSFHLKCYYIDVFRGVNNICLNYTNEVIKYLNCRPNRVLNEGNTTSSNGIGEFNKDFGSSALCQPDGFPIEVFHNGEYYGLFTWNIKKHRANYQMKKNEYDKTILDGELGYGSFFGGNIKWNLFEIKTPKTLILMDGITKYDGDHPQEIISPTMIVDGQEVANPNYDPSNKDHKNTAKTKAMIQELSNAIPTLQEMSIDTQEGLQTAKAYFEAHFDKKMMICYFLLSNVIFHLDGFWKNWIWVTYNGISSPTFYDMDTVFGRHWTGGKLWPGYTTSSIIGNDEQQPCGQVYRLYKDEVESTYADLRNKKLIDADYIIGFFTAWLNRQTREAVERNIKKWPAIPSYRENNGNYPPPLSYDDSVQTEGMYDSIGRVKKWLEKRIPALDIIFNYNQN